VTVTYNGICFKDSEIIRETVYNLEDKATIFNLSGQIQLMRSRTIELNSNQRYIIIHHPWMNYYHWITESLPKLWLIKERLNALCLVLPIHYQKFPFVIESLQPFVFRKIFYIPSGMNIKVKDAIIPQIKPRCSNYDPVFVRNFRTFYTKIAEKKPNPFFNLGQKIYIPRGNSNRRQIVNEQDVIKLLSNFGFKVVNATKFSFWNQIAFSMSAKYLISNGSGLTNMSFMQENTSVLELYKKITNPNDFHDLVLWYLASALNIKYYQQCCEPVDINSDMYTANLYVNLERLEENVKSMLYTS
jgi:capsular polysaccharide biosynthesis protein